MVVASIARIENAVEVEAKPASHPRSIRRPLLVVTSEIKLEARTRAARIAKRAIDVVGSAVGLAVLAPVFAATALAVKVTSRGPIFFVQDRCGLGGRRFRFYKFRTMVVDAEERKASLEHLNEMNGPVFKIASDPRMTRLGAILRKLSADELPQFWNVLKGDMSLHAPSAAVECHARHFRFVAGQRPKRHR